MTIGEVARNLGVSVDTLRYYEKEGIIPRATRDVNGYRKYSESDLRWLGFVSCLKSTGMPLGKVREYQELLTRGNETAVERRDIVIEHRKKLYMDLEKLQKAIEKINHKVEFYDSLIQEHGIEL